MGEEGEFQANGVVLEPFREALVAILGNDVWCNSCEAVLAELRGQLTCCAFRPWRTLVPVMADTLGA